MANLLGTIGLGVVGVFALLVIGVAIMTAVEGVKDFEKKHGMFMTFVTMIGSIISFGLMYIIGTTIEYLVKTYGS